MTPEKFRQLADAGYNHIPVYIKTMADFDTPLSVYMKVGAGPYSYLLESAQGGEKWGRYSFIGLQANRVLTVFGNQLTLTQNGQPIEQLKADDPVDYIETWKAGYRVPDIPELSRFIGGLVGYFGYDTVRYIEHRLQATTPADSLKTPDILLMESNEIIVFDNLRSHMTLIRMTNPAEPDAYETSMGKLNALKTRLQEAPAISATVSRQSAEIRPTEIQFEFEREAYISSVKKILDYIVAGDVMQVVLAHRMSMPFQLPPINLYRALRSLNPSPYMYFMDLDDFQLVSSSPEILARLEDGVITNRPLAGTRPRGRNEAEDLAFEKELLADPKEIAEHLMLIDMGRNDVGKIAATGSVQLTEQMVIERYSHVMHMSSNVVGRLQPGKTALDVLRATLPVGTLSGAPKVRAMEIIDELEPVKRGVYGGAVGYLAWNNNMDMAIAIRTAVIKGGRLYIEAGGGVVADSVPHQEWQESMDKAQAVFRSAALAISQFDLNCVND